MLAPWLGLGLGLHMLAPSPAPAWPLVRPLGGRLLRCVGWPRRSIAVRGTPVLLAAVPPRTSPTRAHGLTTRLTTGNLSRERRPLRAALSCAHPALSCAHPALSCAHLR